MNIVISFTTNARQDQRLADALAFVNSSRPADQQFASVSEFLTDAARTAAINAVRGSDARDQDKVAIAYAAASPATQAQVQSLLGV